MKDVKDMTHDDFSAERARLNEAWDARRDERSQAYAEHGYYSRPHQDALYQQMVAESAVFRFTSEWFMHQYHKLWLSPTSIAIPVPLHFFSVTAASVLGALLGYCVGAN